MNRQKWFRLSGSLFSATVLFLISSVCVGSGADAQSAVSMTVGSPLSGVVPSPFLVARSFSLTSAPSGVAMGDLNQDGRLDLVTADAVSGKVTVFLGMGEARFSAGVEYASGFHPTAVAVADLDGDGRREVVTIDESAGKVAVLSVSADGKLELRQSVSLGITPGLLASGDFNADGRADIAVAAASGNALAVLLNDGKGNLQKPILSALSKAPAAIAAADFNRDGHVDIALANLDGSVSVLIGTGGGKFRSTPDIAVASGPLSAIVAVDFARDGNLGLAVTQSDTGKLSVLLGNGEGGFRASQEYSIGNRPVSVITDDFDGDGIADLIAINRGSNTFSVLGGNGDGSFKGALHFVVGKGPMAAAAGDLDGDGHVDLAVINHDSQSVSLAIGNGDGTFKAGRSYAAEMQPRAVASADLNGDKRQDLVVSNYCGMDAACSKGGTVDVFLASETGEYELAHSYSVGAGPVAVTLLDVDGDGYLDIVALNREDRTISVLLAKGDGSFQQPLTLSVAEAPVGVAVGDFNRDGKQDLAVLEDCGAAKCSQPGSVEVLLGQGDGGFLSAFKYHTGYSPSSIAVGDLNGDKVLDMVIGNRCGRDAGCQSAGTATVLLGGLRGKFTSSPDVALGKNAASIALADLSGLGVLDLAVAGAGDNLVAVLRGNGDGSFAAPVSYKVGNAPGSVTFADFNGDGKLDLAVANVDDATVSILFGKGDGSLTSATTVPVGMGPESLTAVTVKNGNHASLVTANGNSGSAAPGREFTVLANVQPEGNPAGTTASTTKLAPIPAPNPSNVNQAVTLKAAVTSTASSATPTGTVTFNISPNAISDCNGGTTATVELVATQTGAIATCITHALQADSESITAVYSGDTTYATSTSDAATQTITPLTATFGTTVSSSPASTVNQAVKFTATIATGSDAVTPFFPTGTVSFATSSGQICSAVVAKTATATWTASCSTNKLTAGTYQVTASYGGDSNFTVAAAAPITQTVNAVSTTLSITPSVSPVVVNGSVTYTASLATTAVTPTAPSGTVSFLLNGNPISSCTAVAINSSGKWPCTLDNLVAGSATISAAYSGDVNFVVPVAGSLTFAVKPIAATLSLTPSAAPYSIGSPVTLTASLKNVALTPIAPTGTVSITVNGVAPTGCANLNITSGTAGCQTTFSIVQSYVVQAVYSGADSNFTIASSPNQTLTVGKSSATTISFVSSANPSTVNQVVAFTLTVTPPAGASVAPTGNVVFLQGGIALCASPVPLVNNAATCNYAFKQKSAGINITATYNGDANYSKASGTPITQVVQATDTNTTLVSSPSPSTVNELVTFTATVVPAVAPVAGSTAPTGSVTFTVLLNGSAVNVGTCANPINVATAALVTTASCSAKLTESGSYLVTAKYNGNANFNSSTSAQDTQSVGAAGTTITLAALPTPSAVNQQVTFTAVVAPTVASSGSPNPTGSVAFSYVENGTPVTLCGASQPVVTKGPTTSASCITALPNAGTTTIVAAYSGDTNYQAATSQNLNQTVNKTPTAVAISSSVPSAVVDQSVSFAAVIKPAFSGSTNPSGTVTFTVLEGTTPVNACPNAIAVSTTSSVTSAICTTTLPSTGSYTVTAAYVGDANFLAQTSTGLAEAVGASPTSLGLTSSLPNGSFVNESVTFTAAIVPKFAGGTTPTGTVTFKDSSTNSLLCPAVTLSSGVAAPCSAILSTAGTHVINVAFASGDTNFVSANSSISQVVSKATTTVVVGSSSGATAPTSVATQSVTFTATVNPKLATGSVPTGTVTFSLTQTASGSPDTIDPVCPPAAVNASGQATCIVVFSGAEQSGSVTVNASYAGDNNFVANAGSVVQTVQNFTLAFSTPGPVTIYQGYSNAKDPFNPVQISATTVPSGGFSAPLTASCVVTDPATPTVALSDPSCTPTGGSLPDAGSVPFIITASPTAPIGLYNVTLTGTDANPPNLLHSTSFTVYVGNTTGALTLGPGASAVANVIFNTAALPPATAPPATLDPSTIACGTIITLTGTSPNIGGQVTCTNASTSIAVTGDQTTVPVTITTLAPTNTTTAARRAGSVAAAAFWGVPLIAILAWFAQRKSPKRNFFRFLGLLLLVVGLSNVIGCGASFTPPPVPTGGTTPGTYLVQVVITDSNGVKHTAVVPLTVN